jgi:hypothetical protein
MKHFNVKLKEDTSFTPLQQETIRNEVKEWLELFREYLPSPEASDHAKGAHDAVNDLESWLVTQEAKQ